MGKFKRSKSKPRNQRGVLPAGWDLVIPIVKKVFSSLVQEKQIKEFKVEGFRFKKSTFLFEVFFPFWERPANFHVFLSHNTLRECSIRQPKNLTFELLTGSQVIESQVREQVIQWLGIIKSGLCLEDVTIEKLNIYYKQSGIPLSVQKSSQEEDMKEKFDLIVSGFEKSERIGIQIKKDYDGWIQHQNKYPHVPSILLDFSTPIKSVVKAINLIEKKSIGHVDLKFKKAPS